MNIQITAFLFKQNCWYGEKKISFEAKITKHFNNLFDS